MFLGAKAMYCEPPVTPTKNVPRVPAAPVPEYRVPRIVKVRPPMALWKQLIIVGVLGIAAYFILTALAVLQSAR